MDDRLGCNMDKYIYVRVATMRKKEFMAGRLQINAAKYREVILLRVGLLADSLGPAPSEHN